MDAVVTPWVLRQIPAEPSMVERFLAPRPDARSSHSVPMADLLFKPLQHRHWLDVSRDSTASALERGTSSESLSQLFPSQISTGRAGASPRQIRLLRSRGRDR